MSILLSTCASTKGLSGVHLVFQARLPRHLSPLETQKCVDFDCVMALCRGRGFSLCSALFLDLDQAFRDRHDGTIESTCILWS